MPASLLLLVRSLAYDSCCFSDHLIGFLPDRSASV